MSISINSFRLPLVLVFVLILLTSCDVTNKVDTNESTNNEQSIVSKLKSYDNFSPNAYTNKLRSIKMSASWDWEENKRHTLYLTGGSSIEKSLPYYDSSSPAWDDINADEVLRSDGWRLLYKDFGSPSEGASTPFFALYNIYTGGVKVFFYNANVTNNYTKAFVKITTDAQSGSSGSTPSILSFYDDNQVYDTHDYIETYAPTELTPNEWSYFEFYLTGYDPDIGSGKYKDGLIDMELIAFNESQIGLDGQIDLSAFYDPGQSNIFAKTQDALNQLPSGDGNLISDLIYEYNQVDKSNEDLEDQADAEGNEEVKSEILEFTAMAFSDYLPALSGISGFVSKLVGGTSSATLSRLAGSITLSGTSSTQFSNLANFFIRIPGTQRSNEIAAPVYDKPTGIFSLENPIRTSRSNYSERCRDDYYRENCTRRWVVTIEEIQLSVNPVLENNGVNLQMRAAKIIGGSNASDYRSVSSFIGSGDVCNEGPNTRCPGKALTIRATIDNGKTDFIPVEYFKTYPYRN